MTVASPEKETSAIRLERYLNLLRAKIAEVMRTNATSEVRAVVTFNAGHPCRVQVGVEEVIK